LRHRIGWSDIVGFGRASIFFPSVKHPHFDVQRSQDLPLHEVRTKIKKKLQRKNKRYT
jgi:hypothetical protein